MSMPTVRPTVPLIAILVLATLLRVWGLAWGLPSATHYFSYHPDESVVLGTAMGMNAFSGKLLPHFYNYGTAQLYLVNFANSAAFLFGGVDIVPKDLAVWYPQWARMYLIGRCLTAIMGVGTVWVVFALGRQMWDTRAGLLAALILAIMPLHAQHSHWLTVDVPATFWITLSLLWSAKLAAGDVKPSRAAMLAGIFAGLATATKYNMALALVPLAAASFLAPPARIRFFALGLGAAVVAFLAACPGSILESHRFLSDLRYEAVHVQNTDDATFRDTGNGFVYLITRNLDAGLGLPLLLLSLASIGCAMYRRTRGDAVLAAFALPYAIIISIAAVRYTRYVIPLLPLLAVWSGRFLAELSRVPVTVMRRACLAGGAAILLLTLGAAMLLIRPMAQPDNRDEALLKIGTLASAPASIAFPTQPWFQTAPVSPYFASPRPGAWRALTTPGLATRIVYDGQDWDVGLLQTAKPAIVVLSEYDYDDPLRLKDPAAIAYLSALRQDYTRRFVLSDNAFMLSRDKPIDGMPTQGLPHDMLYPNPIISIYQRTSSK